MVRPHTFVWGLSFFITFDTNLEIMIVFIIVPVVDKNGKRLNDLRVNASEIQKYRSWLTGNEATQTVIFFKNGEKLIVDCTAEELDNQIEEQCTSQMA